MKLGWILMPEEPSIHQQMEFVADTYLSVSSPIQAAAIDWLAARATMQQPVRERCLANIATISAALAGTSWSLMPVEAGWAAILRGPTHIEEESAALTLLVRGFSVHPGFYYDLPASPCFVLSLLTPPEHLAAGLAALLTS